MNEYEQALIDNYGDGKPQPTPETDAFMTWLHPSLRFDSVKDKLEKLERERDAAIKMAWELVQELVTKCDDPIHKRQFTEIEKLHHAWTIPQNANNPPTP